MPRFPGVDLCPEDSAHTDSQPQNGTESVSCTSLNPENTRGRVGQSERGPQLPQQNLCNGKTCELNWWLLTSCQLQLPRSKAAQRGMDMA